VLPLTSWLARHNPDLIGSAEGGSNAILARGAAGGIELGRRYTMRLARPERRTMAFARLGCGLCVTSLHASTSARLAETELLRAAGRAVDWAEGAPLVLGGDFNVRPAESEVFAMLAERHGLRGGTTDDAIDHLLMLGADVVEPPRHWAPGERELEEDGLALTLSDHAPVEALLRIQ
jgi:endonuclease/exonuclease/phosphatase family metal-dependent hydrolase